MKKTYVGILGWCSVWILYIIGMSIRNMPLESIIFMIVFWSIAGFFIATTTMKGIMSGCVVSMLLIIPPLIIIWRKDQDELIPIFFLTIFFGWLLGFWVNKYDK